MDESVREEPSIALRPMKTIEALLHRSTEDYQVANTFLMEILGDGEGRCPVNTNIIPNREEHGEGERYKRSKTVKTKNDQTAFTGLTLTLMAVLSLRIAEQFSHMRSRDYLGNDARIRGNQFLQSHPEFWLLCVAVPDSLPCVHLHRPRLQ